MLFWTCCLTWCATVDSSWQLGFGGTAAEQGQTKQLYVASMVVQL